MLILSLALLHSCAEDPAALGGEADAKAVPDCPRYLYPDVDGDGWGDSDGAFLGCVRPANHVTRGGDCDDDEAAAHPRAQEVCDEVDNDCNGVVDDGWATDADPYWIDDDGDGFGDPAIEIHSCEQPPRGVTNSDDCDDTDPNDFPGASAACPGTTCEDIIAADSTLGNGTYTFDPDGDGTSFTADCEMTIDGGGWTQLNADTLASRSSGDTREYLYTYSSGFYISPSTTDLWDWSSFQVLEGSYTYGTGSSISGSFSCSHGESGHFGVGCSNGPFAQYKVLPWGSSTDSSVGYAQICQDQPDVFGVGACAYPTQIWIRP